MQFSKVPKTQNEIVPAAEFARINLNDPANVSPKGRKSRGGPLLARVPVVTMESPLYSLPFYDPRYCRPCEKTRLNIST